MANQSAIKEELKEKNQLIGIYKQEETELNNITVKKEDELTLMRQEIVRLTALVVEKDRQIDN